MRRAVLLLIVVFFISSMTLIGVGCKEEAVTAEEEVVAEEEEAAAPAEEESAEKELKFGVIMRDASASFARVLIAGAQEKADELGIELIINDSNNDSLLQLNQMDTLISTDVDGFVFGGAVDQAAVIPGIIEFNEAGIPVGAIDSAPTGGDLVAYVGSDHSIVAKRAAEALIRLLEEKYGEVPEGKVMKILGSLSDNVCTQCNTGFHSVVDEYPQLTFVEGEGKWNPTDAGSITADLLTAYGDEIIAVYIMYDLMAPGVIPAIEAAGYDPEDLIIVSQDASAEGLFLMRAGKIDAESIQRHFESAKLVVQLLYDYINGEELPQPDDEFEAEGVTWYVLENPYGEGIYINPDALIVPWDVSIDDPIVMGNITERLGE